MNFSQLCESFPVWGLFVATVLLLCFSFESGFLLGKHQGRSLKVQKDSAVGPMIGAALGLVAFMLSFTFGMAASHFDQRRQAVIEEAVAIRSSYALAGFIPDPNRENIRRLLREYVDSRLEDIRSDQKIRSAIVRSEAIHHQLWAEAQAVVMKNPGANNYVFLVQALDDVVRWHVKRIESGLQSEIPLTIWIVLYGVAFMSIAGMGYHAGLSGWRGPFAYGVLILSFTTVLILIADLDRSHQRLFRVNKHALINLQGEMSANKL